MVLKSFLHTLYLEDYSTKVLISDPNIQSIQKLKITQDTEIILIVYYRSTKEILNTIDIIIKLQYEIPYLKSVLGVEYLNELLKKPNKYTDLKIIQHVIKNKINLNDLKDEFKHIKQKEYINFSENDTIQNIRSKLPDIFELDNACITLKLDDTEDDHLVSAITCNNIPMIIDPNLPHYILEQPTNRSWKQGNIDPNTDLKKIIDVYEINTSTVQKSNYDYLCFIRKDRINHLKVNLNITELKNVLCPLPSLSGQRRRIKPDRLPPATTNS